MGVSESSPLSLTKTLRSFLGKSSLMDLKKAELLTLNMNYVFKQQKVLDAIIQNLKMIKAVLKPEKLTLFVIN